MMSVAKIRKQARILMWLVTVPFAGLAVLTILLLGNIVWQGGHYADTVAIYYLPMFLYMWAIWMIRSALKAIARGALFDKVIATLLFRVGLALFGGALFTVIGVPLMTALVTGSPWLRTFEPSPVTLGVVGAALMLLSQLFARASVMRDEIEGFF
ncbi:DUF2975 domain-containing protein [Sphingomonas aerolata]|jgi:hypothetical protein|uniref:DUF2975 domain-containing protein n=1 Tax=Sphingomonas aerolata TaxID=185951 RepID=UPI003346D8A0